MLRLRDVDLLATPALLEAENDNGWIPDEPAEQADAFGEDWVAWLDWLMDCVAIESALRRTASAQRGLAEGERGAAGVGAAGVGAAGVAVAISEATVRDSTRPIGR